mmetsp:Transcript_3974/g.11313  ORF Transcript_3974/g.11313 Transcript_3974/m.11313 type:complete len:202 (+) Transcript_3974:630-1235(+)
MLMHRRHLGRQRLAGCRRRPLCGLIQVSQHRVPHSDRVGQPAVRVAATLPVVVDERVELRLGVIGGHKARVLLLPLKVRKDRGSCVGRGVSVRCAAAVDGAVGARVRSREAEPSRALGFLRLEVLLLDDELVVGRVQVPAAQAPEEVWHDACDRDDNHVEPVLRAAGRHADEQRVQVLGDDQREGVEDEQEDPPHGLRAPD